ncbi:hypothetical protein LINPERPRIM_LOCUS17987 [Linum perenne]
MAAKYGYPLRSILVHSLWMTAIGILLFRLATASSQRLVFVELFAVSGTVLATAPWVFQLLISTAIVVLYNAQVCDFTWLVRSASSSEDPEQAFGIEFVDGNPFVMRDGMTKNYPVHLWRDTKLISETTPPRLQRNRTV